LKVIQWATGGVGKAAIEGVINHPELELVGCYVHSSSKNGRDVGEILGSDPLGVTASSSVDDVLAVDADCVMYSPLVANDDEVKAILRSGKNVVTPIGWVYPDRTHPKVRAIAQAAIEGGVTLHGSGIHPGGITERFPLMVSSLSSGDHPHSGRRILRHPHLQLPRRRASHHGIRRITAGRHARTDGHHPGVGI
jgi:hypothetical protein